MQTNQFVVDLMNNVAAEARVVQLKNIFLNFNNHFSHKKG